MGLLLWYQSAWFCHLPVGICVTYWPNAEIIEVFPLLPCVKFPHSVTVLCSSHHHPPTGTWQTSLSIGQESCRLQTNASTPETLQGSGLNLRFRYRKSDLLTRVSFLYMITTRRRRSFHKKCSPAASRAHIIRDWLTLVRRSDT